MRRPAILLSAALLVSACSAGAGAVAASTAPPTTASPAAANTSRTCLEPGPDKGPVDLQAVSLRTTGSRLTATFRLGAPPSAVPGVLQLTLGIWDEDGTARRALDVRWVEGVPRVRLYDVEPAREEQLDVRPTVSGGTVTVRFPEAATAGLGDSWRWEAFATVDGTAVDDCPVS